VMSDDLPEFKDFRRAYINPHILEVGGEDMLQVTATVMDMEMTAMPVVVLLLQTNSQLIF
jgi:hypothetical protein